MVMAVRIRLLSCAAMGIAMGSNELLWAATRNAMESNVEPMQSMGYDDEAVPIPSKTRGRSGQATTSHGISSKAMGSHEKPQEATASSVKPWEFVGGHEDP